MKRIKTWKCRIWNVGTSRIEPTTARSHNRDAATADERPLCPTSNTNWAKAGESLNDGLQTFAGFKGPGALQPRLQSVRNRAKLKLSTKKTIRLISVHPEAGGIDTARDKIHSEDSESCVLCHADFNHGEGPYGKDFNGSYRERGKK